MKNGLKLWLLKRSHELGWCLEVGHLEAKTFEGQEAMIGGWKIGLHGGHVWGCLCVWLWSCCGGGWTGGKICVVSFMREVFSNIPKIVPA